MYVGIAIAFVVQGSDDGVGMACIQFSVFNVEIHWWDFLFSFYSGFDFLECRSTTCIAINCIHMNVKLAATFRLLNELKSVKAFFHTFFFSIFLSVFHFVRINNMQSNSLCSENDSCFASFDNTSATGTLDTSQS